MIADHISVDSTADDMGFFTATGVTFNKPGRILNATWRRVLGSAESGKRQCDRPAAAAMGTTMTTGLRYGAAGR